MGTYNSAYTGEQIDAAVEAAHDATRRLQFSDTVVAVGDWAADTTYADYPFRAAVLLSGALANMTPEVVAGLAEATSGNIAPIAAAYDGGVYLYAAAVPATSITIPTIILWKAVA